tara:strand:+ start:669 stop:1622 length:954 start_codon:yes stop_codon:yes gene_type:complete
MNETFINQLETLKQEIKYAEGAYLRYDRANVQDKSEAFDIFLLYAYFFIKQQKQLAKRTDISAYRKVLKYGKEYSQKAVDVYFAHAISYAKMVYNHAQQNSDVDLKSKLGYFYLIDDAIIKLRDIYNENYHYKVCTTSMKNKHVLSVLKSDQPNKIWISNIDIVYLEELLRNKIKFAMARKPKVENADSLLSFKSLRSTAIITEMLYDIDQASKLNEFIDVRAMKDSVSLIVEYMSHSKLIYCDCLFSRYKYSVNLQIKSDYVFYIYQLITLIEFIDYYYCEVYDNKIYYCYYMLNDNESDFINLLNSRNFLVKKML